MSDASLSLSEMEPYFSYYPDKLYKNLVELVRHVKKQGKQKRNAVSAFILEKEDLFL